MPELSTFEIDMGDDAKRNRLYETLIKDGYDLPDFKTFTQDIQGENIFEKWGGYEIKSFVSGKDTYDIPIKEIEQFKKNFPNAKPLVFVPPEVLEENAKQKKPWEHYQTKPPPPTPEEYFGTKSDVLELSFQPLDKLTIDQFADKVKNKYSDYKDVNNAELVSRILKKYPQYSKFINTEDFIQDAKNKLQELIDREKEQEENYWYKDRFFDLPVLSVSLGIIMILTQIILLLAQGIKKWETFPARIILITMLLVALIDMPYSYYEVLRVVAFVVFGYLVYFEYQYKHHTLALIFAVAVVLFNPISKIELEREIWAVVDAVYALILYASIFINEKSFFTSKMKISELEEVS